MNHFFPTPKPLWQKNLRFFSWIVIVRQTSRPLSHVNSMLKINCDLSELWKGVRGLEKSPIKLWSIYCVYSDNISNTKFLETAKYFSICFENIQVQSQLKKYCSRY